MGLLPVDFSAFVPSLSGVMYWVGYILVVCAVFGVFIGFYFLMGYRYKVTIMEQRGIGRQEVDGVQDFSIGRIKRDRAKEIKVGGVTKWKLLFSKQTIQPPSYSNIYPGNTTFLFRTGKTSFFPVKFKCSNPSAEFVPMPQDVRAWEQIELQQGAQDYLKQSFFDKYGTFFITVGTVFLCLLLAGATVYFTYQHADGVTSRLGSLTDAIRNSNLIR